MKATGIVRRIDDLGRVVIPKEIRRTMRIREGDPLEIFTNGDGVVFKKYSLMGGLGDFSAQLCESLYKTTGKMVTITDRPTTDAFLKLYKSFGVDVSLRTVGAGTAVQETLSTLGLEKTEKAVLFAIITADSWPRIQKALRRQMRIDVPGTGIAFIVPVSSIGGKRALLFLTEHQTLELKEESTLKDTHYDLLLVIANQGYTGSIMDAARAAGAGGGTVIHAKGTGMEGAARFMGIDLVNEKELVLIVSRTSEKNAIMKAIMDNADKKAGSIVFSLPVTDTAGLRLLDEE